MTIDRSRVLIQGIVGSTAYGLNHADSDIDQLGVYVAPMNVVLGLKATQALEDPEGPQPVDDTLVQHEPDLTLHEVGKYVSLALSANPTILELLWLPSYPVLHPLGLWLVHNRQIFLSERTVKGRYGGYAKQQAERLLRRHEDGKDGFSSDVKQRTAKHGRHCMRLLLQGAQLLRTGTMTVNVSEHRDDLFAAGVRAAENPQAFHEEAMDRIYEFDQIESVLPAQPDRDRADVLLQEIRWAVHERQPWE